MKIHQVSHFLKAVSVSIFTNTNDLEHIEQQKEIIREFFLKNDLEILEITPVARFTPRKIIDDDEEVEHNIDNKNLHSKMTSSNADLVESPYNYGNSFFQVSLVGGNILHQKGYNGTGIRVAVFDSGFYMQHPAFAHLKIIATKNFVNNDTDGTFPPGGG